MMYHSAAVAPENEGCRRERPFKLYGDGRNFASCLKVVWNILFVGLRLVGLSSIQNQIQLSEVISNKLIDLVQRKSLCI